MPEIVLGTGRLKTIRIVADVLANQIFKLQGAPRKLTARAETIEFSAERPEFEGEFETFNLRARVSKAGMDQLSAVAQQYEDVCYMAEEMGWQVMDCPGLENPDADRKRIKEAVDKLCECLVLPEVWRVQGENYRVDPISAELLFKAMMQYKASDIHLSPGEKPIFRIDGQTRHSELLNPLSAAQILGLIRQITTDRNWVEFENLKQTTFNYHQIGLGYARVSAFMKSGAPHVTFRFLPEKIPSFEDLNIPIDTMNQLASLHRGLMLVAGMSGSGKTTTAAAIIDWNNQNKSLHIVTVEDPIEYVHLNKKSIISQRSVGEDTNSYSEGVIGSTRHDPDIIMLGEMRDADSVRSALNAAATGKLVISTVQSNTASEVVSQLIGFFDPIERDLIKLQIRDCLQCIICQRLVPKKGGGRLPAMEFFFNDIKPIADAILAGDTDGMRIGMQQKQSHSFIFETYLYKLYKEDKISVEMAREFSTDISVFDQMLMGTYSVPRLEQLKAARDASQRGA